LSPPMDFIVATISAARLMSHSGSAPVAAATWSATLRISTSRWSIRPRPR
jgi:hypothetical protein